MMRPARACGNTYASKKYIPQERRDSDDNVVFCIPMSFSFGTTASPHAANKANARQPSHLRWAGELRQGLVLAQQDQCRSPPEPQQPKG
jgi:hypothetical protein